MMTEEIHILQNKEQIIELLIENKAYPCCSKYGKIFFRKRGKSENFNRMKNEIVEKLELETEEDCRKIRAIIKNELAKRRTTKPIKKWVKDERPREMLIEKGAENLNTAKLLAILLRTGAEGISAEDLARRLLNNFGSLRALDSASVSDLQAVENVGMAKATQIKAALELGKRLMKERAHKKRKISTIKDVVEYVSNYYAPYLRDLKKEIFNLILLDGRNKLIKNIELSKGSLTASVVDPMEIIKEATKESATTIILVHNHPSGEVEPTPEDIETTRQVLEACNVVGIKVLDHIIIGKNEEDYFSFLEKGFLRNG